MSALRSGDFSRFLERINSPLPVSSVLIKNWYQSYFKTEDDEMHTTHSKGKAERIMIVVWDGMRPDLVSPANTASMGLRTTGCNLF